MKYILLIIYYNILSLFSAYEIKPKLCIDCKFFRKSNLSNDNKFAKCLFFPERNDPGDHDYYFLVTGIKQYTEQSYYYCATSRKFDYMCGKEGKFYEEKI